MKLRITLFFLFISVSLFGQKPRLVVTTDIGQDPDDQQSLVRLLHYANEFDIEGIIANADANYDKEPPVLKDTIIHNLIEAYATVESNLRLHDLNFPTATQLRAVVKRGCSGNAETIPYTDFVGEDKDTEGSDWLIRVVDRTDDRPVNIAVWGGACDLAQALWKVSHTRSGDQTEAFVRKLRVYFIGKQDSSNDWIIENFPGMWLILALDRGGDKWESGYRGMFWGGDMGNTSREWLQANVLDVSPLSKLYPDRAFTGGEKKNPYMAMKEGDSPSFLYFIDNGLNVIEHPSWGGWGGRYSLERDQFFRDASDTYYDAQAGKAVQSPRATVFRWRPDFQSDFACRVRWATQSVENANHYPHVVVNGRKEKNPLFLNCRPEQTVRLDASGSVDPDGDELNYEWIVYPEAGTYPGAVSIIDNDKIIAEVSVPKDAKGKTVHIILRVKDGAGYGLIAYRRIVLQVQ